MSTSISPDVAYIIKQFDEVHGDRHKRKHDFSVRFNENDSPINGDRLEKDETQLQPKVQVNNVDDTSYRTLMMVDPDAPSRDDPTKGPFLHWVIANFQKEDLSDGQTLYPYNGPQPPTGTGPHRYMFLLYQSIDKVSEKKHDRQQRLRFPLQQYITDNRLGLLDATYFIVEG